MKHLLLIALFAIFPATFACAGAELGPPRPFPPLEDLVRKADLVLLCRLEGTGKKERWRVIEALKGEYRPKMFDQEKPGFIEPDTGTITFASPSRDASAPPKHKERIVFLRLLRLHSDQDNKWHDLYYVDEAFPVVGGKLTYPKTMTWTHTVGAVEREFTVAEFTAAVRAVK